MVKSVKSVLNLSMNSNRPFVICNSDVWRRISVLLVEQGTGIVVAYGNDLDEMKVFCDMNMLDYVVE